MINFLRRLFGTQATADQPAPSKVESQVHSTDAVHEAVFVSPPSEQPKKPAKKPSSRSSSSRRKPTTKKS